jgi:hypothetical protein
VNDGKDVSGERASPAQAFIARWARISARFFSLQLAIQGLNFLAGLITVWSLSKHAYALVTLAITLLGAMVVLSNLGISIGVTSIGGRVAADRVRFGAVIVTALRLRRMLALVVFPVLAAILGVMLHQAQADVWTIAAITVTVLGIAVFELNAALLSSALLLRDRVLATQSAEFCASLLRLAIIAGLAFPGWLSATITIGASLVGTWLRQHLLLRSARAELDLTAQEIPEDRTEIIRLVRLEAPNALFYCLQGQITVAIMIWFGSVGQIAEYGALYRFQAITTLLGSFFHALLIPRFNRLQTRAALTERYLLLVALTLGIVLTLLVASILVPGPILWFLGPQYAHLRHELPLMVGNLMLSFLVGIAWAMNACKAWIPIIARANIPLTLLTQIVIAPLCALDTLAGIIWFSIISQVPALLLIACDAWRGLRAAPTALP